MLDKICNCCKKKKLATLDYFYVCKQTKSGLRGKCKECMYIEKEKNRKIRARKRSINNLPSWTTRNRRKKKAKQLNITVDMLLFYRRQKKIILKNKRQLNKLLIRLNKFNSKLDKFNPKLIKKDLKHYKEHYQISDSDWSELKKDNPKASALIYRIRYKYVTEFNLKERLRNQLTKQKKKYPNLDYAIRLSVSKNQNTKYLDILGYTKEELKNHLEKQFTNDMSWKDFRNGKIHIDHIKPQSLFNLKDINDIKECWSLDNLQPLWAKDNIRKSNKYYDK